MASMKHALADILNSDLNVHKDVAVGHHRQSGFSGASPKILESIAFCRLELRAPESHHHLLDPGELPIALRDPPPSNRAALD